MYSRRGVKVLYLGIKGMGISRSLNKDKAVKSEVKCLRHGNAVSFYKVYTAFVNEISISIISIARTNYKCFEEIIEKEINENDNVLILGDDERKSKIDLYIKSIKDKLKNYIDIKLDKNFIDRSLNIEKEKLTKEIFNFFIRKILIGNIKKEGNIYLTPIGNVNRFGKTVYKVLEENKNLQYAMDLRIDIFSGKEFDLNDLTHIIDPIQEYLDSKSLIEINNINLENKEELYFLMLEIN
ncbi:MAG: hypothetical protein ACRDCB_06470 [Clostridium sp.]|uniref:hypothetical protein n=1 Tax=Clostridium TaxID=1485 RepID=UPI0021530AE4|nr:hypothetical protein [Clostridium sp. LY3-2]MCR6514136.1 hypothetical protein [Clostridium sp. LY3-2]